MLKAELTLGGGGFLGVEIGAEVSMSTKDWEVREPRRVDPVERARERGLSTMVGVSSDSSDSTVYQLGEDRMFKVRRCCSGAEKT